jgi:hypothetical protein
MRTLKRPEGRNDAVELMGSAAASAAVRRALAPKPGMYERTKQWTDWVHAVVREGAVHCARGGRAPQVSCIVTAEGRAPDVIGWGAKHVQPDAGVHFGS